MISVACAHCATVDLDRYRSYSYAMKFMRIATKRFFLHRASFCCCRAVVVAPTLFVSIT
jgi:hypothetical protein